MRNIDNGNLTIQKRKIIFFEDGNNAIIEGDNITISGGSPIVSEVDVSDKTDEEFIILKENKQSLELKSNGLIDIKKEKVTEYRENSNHVN